MKDNQRQTHWSYIAGILDADGCFMITKHNRHDTDTSMNRRFKILAPTYMPTVKIAMIEFEAINFILDMGYGKYNIDGARKDRPNSKPIYQWYLRGKKHITPFLKEVIPFLKIKQKRAKFLLDFCNNADFINHGYKGLSVEELDYREDSYIKMRELNGNKVAATTNPRRCENISDSLNISEMR